MKKALIIVDYQYDFVAEDGALTVGKKAQDIEKNISELAEQYDCSDIFFTFDKHKESDWETDVFPEAKIFAKHCIYGTKGYRLYGKIKGFDNVCNHITKHAYCPSNDVINHWVTEYDEIMVVGVVTDICVFQTIVGLYTEAVNRGKKIRLVVNAKACASFNEEREKQMLQYMKEILYVEIG